ncbi:MAG: hypothetical protein JWM33_199 [Caulobacteraceae bacterium]|nr:hypothetical protein [Caulobacteraceae bacterium]
MSEKTSSVSRRRGIQSVEIGLRVLQALAGLDQAASLGAVAQASGVSASQAHRYLVSLMAAGMAQQDPASGRYDLGPAALQLGLGALARTDAFKIADKAIADFVLRTGWTVQIAAYGPQGPTIVRWLMGRPAVMTSFTVGSVLPLLFSATGQIFTAFLPASETAALIEREQAQGQITDAEIEALRLRVRAAGNAAVDGTMVPGLRAFAYPIFDIQGRPILSATALGPDAVSRSGDDAALAELARVCGEISRQLGWRQSI